MVEIGIGEPCLVNGIPVKEFSFIIAPACSGNDSCRPDVAGRQGNSVPAGHNNRSDNTKQSKLKWPQQ